MAGKLANILMGTGYAALGAGMLLKVVDALSGKDDEGAPAPGPDEEQVDRAPDFGRLVFGKGGQRSLPAPKGRAVEGGSIENRLKMIAELVRKGGKTPAIHEQAKIILTQKCRDGSSGREKWCVPPKDWRAEVLAIHRAICDPNEKAAARYVRDMLRADTFSAAHRTAFITHGEDCDGLGILEGALLESVGHPVRLRVVAANGKASWSHIYLLTGLPPDNPTEWMPLDPSMPEKPAGWEAPGAETVARSGRRASDGRALGTGQSPAGIISRVLDYSV